MFTTTSAKLTGTPGKSGWSQVYEFSPIDQEKLLRRGSLYAVIATKHQNSKLDTGPVPDGGIDTINAGRELFARLSSEYYETGQGSAFNVLKNSVEKLVGELSRVWGEVEIAALVTLGDVVYSVVYGGGGAMILRSGSLAKLLESRSGQIATASGYPKENDRILIATGTFFRKFPYGVIKAALSMPTPTEGIETLTPLTHSDEDSGRLGAVILGFSKQKTIQFQNIETKQAPAALVGNSLLVKIKSSIASFYAKLPKRAIYIKPQLTEEVSPQSKKVTFTVAIILLILLGVSIGFGVRQKRLNDLKSQYLGILQEAGSEVDQAISLASVSSERSRELFAAAEQKIAQVDALNVKDPLLTEIKQKISESRASILGEYLVQPEMFLDLSLLSSGFTGNTLVFTGGQIYVMDVSGKRVVSVDTATKKSKVVAGPSVIKSAATMGAYEDRVFIPETDGIYEIDSGIQKVIEKTWNGDVFITAFAGNIYVLDKGGGAIYRYSGSGNSFGSQQNWLAAGANVDFSGAVQMSIDGSIYVLFPNSKILKFSQGSPQNFRVSGAVPEIGNIDAVSASPDNEYIYLLDKGGRRVVVVDKKGLYKAQYVNDQISQATSLVVSESDAKIILLVGDKLHSIAIKH